MAKRQRLRIAVWIGLATVAPVLLLTTYVSAWLAMPWAIHNDHIDYLTALRIDPVFYPLDWYAHESELPGSRRLLECWGHLNERYYD